MTTEKRRHIRFDAVNPSQVNIYSDEDSNVTVQEGQGKTLNMSKGGVLLETPFPIALGQKLSLIININTESVYLSGKVAHTRCEATNCYKTGIQFTSIDDKGRQILDKYIAMFMEQQEESLS